MNIYELVNKYVTAGYSEDDAIPKVAQDIVLLKIGNSKYNKNITVKGGVVMHNISKDMRRATRDMDIDFIKYGCDNGYSSVMYDGSVLSFEENAKNTAIVTEYAHKKGFTVEAELGHVGNASVGSISETGTDTDPGESLTVPEEVAKFVEITDVDALAVAIGTSHGVYQKTPELRIDRLDEITAVCDRPLVLHGGSGTSEQDFKDCIHNGISKINVATALQIAITDKVIKYIAECPSPNYIDMKMVMTHCR